MKFCLSKEHSDEDRPLTKDRKLGIIYSSRENVIRLCDFFVEIQGQLKNPEKTHMHFRDSFKDFDKIHKLNNIEQ